MVNTHKLVWKQVNNSGKQESRFKMTNSANFQLDVRRLREDKTVSEIRCFKL